MLAAIAAGAGAWWSYGRATPAVAGWRRALLAALRGAVLLAVFLLLFEPILRRVTGREDEAVVAVLLDDTRSLTAATPGQPAPAARLADALPDLPRGAGVRYYAFGAGVERLDGRPDSLALAGERTDIAGALQRVDRDLGGRNLRAVLLVSDGRFTAGRSPARVAARYPVPIYTSVVGDSVSVRDVRVADVLTNDIAYVGSELPVRIAVQATGYAGRRATVVLSEGGRSLARGEVALPSDGGEAVVELAVTPAAPGLRQYTASVSALPGEATTRNNSASASVRVLDQRRRLLVLAAAPGPDLAALRAVLDADDQMQPTYRTQRAPGAFYEGALPEALERPAAAGGFDAIVLVGYPGAAADAGHARRVAAAIRAGRPALFLLTRQTDLAALTSAFTDVLPVVPELSRPGWAEATAGPTPAGAAHALLDLPGDGAGVLGRLPALEVSESRWAPSPGARVLATARRGGVDTGAPLLVVRDRVTGEAGGRTAALLGAGTWRWRTLPADLAGLAPVYPRLIDNLVRWTTTREDRRRVRVRPTRPAFAAGERVQFTGQVYDEALQPVSDAEIRVVLAGPGGQRPARTMRALGNGRYGLDAGALPPGRWTFDARTAQGSDRGVFAVGAVADEFRQPGADPALMREVALRSGGRAVPLDSVAGVMDLFRRDGRLEPRVVERTEETPLLDMPLLLGLIIACLTAEWVARKRWGMV